MYNPCLTDDQIAIRDTVREFVQERVFPVATRSDRLEPLEVPLAIDLVDAAGELGLRTLTLSEAAGGAGADILTSCIVAEELAVGDADVAAVLMCTAALGSLLFNRLMNSDQQQRFLRGFVEDHRFHLALAEHEEGIDTALGINYHRDVVQERNLATSAKKMGSHWVVNGRKVRVANAPVAKLFAVLVEAEDGPCILLVPRDTPGLSVKELGRFHGSYVGACGDVTFENCRVEAANILGPEATGILTGPHANFGLSTAQAINLGVGRAAFEAAFEYAGIRIQGARRIIEHQAIGAKLARLVVDLETTRAVIWQGAWFGDNPDTNAGGAVKLPHQRIAQIVTAERIFRVTREAADCFGAMGVMRDMPLQKYIHLSRVFLHTGEGHDDTLLRIAETLVGRSQS